MQNLQPLANLHSWAGQFESYLVANPETGFLVIGSYDDASILRPKNKTIHGSNNPANSSFSSPGPNSFIEICSAFILSV